MRSNDRNTAQANGKRYFDIPPEAQAGANIQNKQSKEGFQMCYAHTRNIFQEFRFRDTHKFRICRIRLVRVAFPCDRSREVEAKLIKILQLLADLYRRHQFFDDRLCIVNLDRPAIEIFTRPFVILDKAF